MFLLLRLAAVGLPLATGSALVAAAAAHALQLDTPAYTSGPLLKLEIALVIAHLLATMLQPPVAIACLYTKRWLWLGGIVASTRTEVNQRYAWDDGDEELQLDDLRIRQRIALSERPGDARVVAGLRALRVELDDDHHMSGWASAVRVDAWRGGEADLDVALMFKQWNQGTRDKLLAFASPGEASFSAEIAVLQLGAAPARPPARPS